MTPHYGILPRVNLPPHCSQKVSSDFRLSKEERRHYVDEADRFYADPKTFLKTLAQPQRLVFFNALTASLELWKDRYRECARFFNTRWHDDSRRRGDVIVWCLLEE